MDGRTADATYIESIICNDHMDSDDDSDDKEHLQG